MVPSPHMYEPQLCHLPAKPDLAVRDPAVPFFSCAPQGDLYSDKLIFCPTCSASNTVEGAKQLSGIVYVLLTFAGVELQLSDIFKFLLALLASFWFKEKLVFNCLAFLCEIKNLKFLNFKPKFEAKI